MFVDEKAQFDPAYRTVQWQRMPGEATIRLPVPENGRGRADRRARTPRDGNGRAARSSLRRTRGPTRSNCRTARNATLRALTVTVVNRRKATQRRFADVTFAFQVRLEVRCASGLVPAQRHDRLRFVATPMRRSPTCTTPTSPNTPSAATPRPAGRADEDGVVRAAFTDFLPTAEVERVEPNEEIARRRVRNGELLPTLAASGRDTPSPTRSRTCRASTRPGSPSQEAGIAAIAGAPRQATATAPDRLRAAGARPHRRRHRTLALAIAHARLAFRAMNEAVARAARQREAILSGGDPAAQRKPEMAAVPARLHPAQPLPGLQDPLHADREIVDLLFFPTGGGKTEAYLGLAAWTIAHRRITNAGTLGAGRRGPDALHACAS